jgi:hypothetical protein
MNKNFLLGLTGLLLLGGATVGFAQERERARRHDGPAVERNANPDERARGERFRGGETRGPEAGAPEQRRFGGERLRERVRDARRFVRSLDLTPEQREDLKAARRELAPIAKELRPEVREVLDGARELRRAGKRAEAREYLRQELRPLRDEARERGLPVTRPLIDQLTPEQRAKCEERARAHGREFDPERAAKRLGVFLSAKRGPHHGEHALRGQNGERGPRGRDEAHGQREPRGPRGEREEL